MTEENNAPAQETNASKDEQIGFHKGSLSTLAKERSELMKIVSIVEQLMQMHVKGLQELGVDLNKMAQDAQQQQGQGTSQNAAPKGDSKPIDDLLR